MVDGRSMREESGGGHCEIAPSHSSTRRGAILGMSRKGNCYDNAPVGCVFSLLKNELVRHRQFQNQAGPTGDRGVYRGVHNRQRLHQALDYRSPEELEKMAVESSSRCPLFRGHLTMTPSLSPFWLRVLA